MSNKNKSIELPLVLRNFVAKHCLTFNRATVQVDKKKQYKRTAKHRDKEVYLFQLCVA